jgi:hypothetical protein
MAKENEEEEGKEKGKRGDIYNRELAMNHS